MSWLSYGQSQSSQVLCYLLQSSLIISVATLSRLFLKILVVDELAAKSHNFPISKILFLCSQALRWTKSWTTWLQPKPSLSFLFRYVLIRNNPSTYEVQCDTTPSSFTTTCYYSLPNPRAGRLSRVSYSPLPFPYLSSHSLRTRRAVENIRINW